MTTKSTIDYKNHRFEVLDSFRGLLSLFVAIFHLRILNSFTEYSFFRNSAVFVEFFFVLSGFVLAFAYSKSIRLNFKRFAVARTFRIVPLHIFMLFLFVLLECCKFIFFEMGVTFSNVPFTGANSLFEIIPNFFLIQSWVPWANSFSFNYPSWSISVEFYIYFIFAVTFLFNVRVSIWFLLCFTSIFITFYPLSFIAKGVLSGLVNFFLGTLFFTLFVTNESKFSLIKIKMFTVLEIGMIGIIFLVITNDFYLKSLFTSLVFGIAIFIFSFEKGIISTLLKLRPFRLLGELSYSVYLVHSLIFTCVYYIFKLMNKNGVFEYDSVNFLNLGNSVLNNLFGIFLLVVVVVVSKVSFQLIELPFQRKGKILARKIDHE